jgi:hypothetical protein
MQSLYNMFHQWLMFAVKSTIDVVVTGDFSSANIEFLKSIKSLVLQIQYCYFYSNTRQNIFLLGLRRGIKSTEKTKAPRKIVDDFGR